MTDGAAKGPGSAATTANGTQGDSKNGQQSDAAPTAKPNDSGKQELSGKDKKLQAKAEKAARRLKEKKEAASAGESAGAGAGAGPSSEASSSTQGARKNETMDKLKGGDKHKRTGSSSAVRPGQQQQLPTRRRPSQPGSREQAQSAVQPKPKSKPKPPKQVSFLSHLYAAPRRHTIADAGKDVHPTILTLAQQTAHYAICGSQARTVAMLLALKSVIATYTTPPGTSLPRHLSRDFLSPQLTHLKAHGRPFCTAQSAAVRWLKNAIATLDPSLPEHEAKNRVLRDIDTFVRERFAVADQVIAAEVAGSWIGDGDVVLVFGKSAVVARALREAVRRGRRFRVVVADSRPLHEGKALAQSLRALRPRDDADDGGTASAGAIETTYVPLASLAHALDAHPPTVALLGAHTVLGDGAVQARAGTALVALLARDAGAPAVVLAESVKFAERVAADSLGGNELAPEDALVGPALEGWRDVDRLHVANLVYDVTPPGLVSAVVTELGTLPPGAAPSVLRMVGGAGEGVV